MRTHPILALPGDLAPRVLVLAATDDPGSGVARLAGAVAVELATSGADTTRISLYDYPLPLAPAEAAPDGVLPQNVRRLADAIRGHDAICLMAGERNGSLTALAKNMIDWLTPAEAGEGEPNPWSRVVLLVALLSAAPSSASAGHLRTILEAAGAARIEDVAIFDRVELGRSDDHRFDAAIASRIRAAAEALLGAVAATPAS